MSMTQKNCRDPVEIVIDGGFDLGIYTQKDMSVDLGLLYIERKKNLERRVPQISAPAGHSWY